MGGDTTTQSPLRGALQDAGQAPERVVSSGKEEGEGGGGSQTVISDRRDDKGRTQWDGGRGYGGDQVEDAYRGFQLGEGGGSRSDSVQVGSACGGFQVAGVGPDPQVGKVLMWHWPCGGYVEGSGGNFKPPARSLHHLPQLPPHILVGSQNGYRHPQGQTA